MLISVRDMLASKEGYTFEDRRNARCLFSPAMAPLAPCQPQEEIACLALHLSRRRQSPKDITGRSGRGGPVLRLDRQRHAPRRQTNVRSALQPPQKGEHMGRKQPQAGRDALPQGKDVQGRDGGPAAGAAFDLQPFLTFIEKGIYSDNNFVQKQDIFEGDLIPRSWVFRCRQCRPPRAVPHLAPLAPDEYRYRRDDRKSVDAECQKQACGLP